MLSMIQMGLSGREEERKGVTSVAARVPSAVLRFDGIAKHTLAASTIRKKLPSVDERPNERKP